MSFLDDLNEEQLMAVRETEGPMLVLAGAGSGKTRVLTHKLAHLISTGCAGSREICAVTFTNKAASEMKERISELVRDNYFPYVGTFHSFCARFLRAHGDRRGINPNYSIYDDHDSKAVIRECLEELKVDDETYSRERIRNTISRLKNRLIDASAYAASSIDCESRVTAEIYSLYQSKLRAYGALDFDDLLLETVYVLRQNSEVLGEYGASLKYMLVDEYQDINQAQYELIRLLGSGHRNITVVGDDDQSIYRFRGADMELLFKFEWDFPEAKVIKLERNYRSTGNILLAANHLMQHNKLRKEKNLWTEREGGEEIGFFDAATGKSEAMLIAKAIRWLIRDEGRTFRDFAVLYRTNAQSRLFEEAFVVEAIPYNLVGSLRFYERREIKDLMAYLRLIVNPGDGISLKRIINVPSRGIGKVTLRKIEEMASARGISLLEAASTFAEEVGGSSKVREKLKSLIEVIAGAREHVDSRDAHEILEMVMTGIGYYEYITADGTAESAARGENIDEFVNKVKEFEQGAEDRTLQTFLAHVSLLSDIDLWSEDEGLVNLMTLHCAKGLEFPVVFIAGMEEKLIPHAMCTNDEREIEEERRLCYVGFTRAEDRLFISCARERFERGEIVEHEPSRFIEEIPKDLIKVIEAQSGRAHVRRREAPEFPSRPRQSLFNEGQRVKHEIFGEGTVTGLSGDVAEVEFDNSGVKKIVGSYLTPLGAGQGASSGLSAHADSLSLLPASCASSSPAGAPSLSRGDRVMHREWGKGIVCSLYPNKNEALVSFPKVGLRSVSAKELTSISANLDENIRLQS